MRSHHFCAQLAFVGLSLSTLVSATAQAECPATPDRYDEASCNILAGPTDICALSGTTYTCDLSSSSTSGTATIVQDYSADYDYEAWGELNGTLFCCEIDDPGGDGIAHFVIQGGDAGDLLGFNVSAGTYNLKSFDSGSMNIDGTIWGDSGNDVIHGSFEDHASYAEYLRGEANADTIHGNDGADDIEGGDGDDTLNGGDGADDMDGGQGGDIMTGGDGNDIMYGGAGAGVDRMSGNLGADDMDGGQGGDVMCGGDNIGDVLDDGDTDAEALPDKLWTYQDLADDYCQDSSTYWDNKAQPHGSCGTNYLTSKPGACP